MLTDGGSTTALKELSKTLGYEIRGGSLTKGAILAQVPGSLSDSSFEASVCGIKGFMIDEVRAFQDDSGKIHTIRCAKVAALEITDSPVHVHGETLESYHILEGEGKMVLDDEVMDVGPGSFVLLPPGVEHGLAANDALSPMKVCMTFTPGLAPIQHEQFRDEKILYDKASERIKALTD